MFKVTFKSSYQIKEGKKWVTKTSQWEELVKSEVDARIRALALSWLIVNISPLKKVGA